MRRGRPPKPTRLKIIEGNRGRRPLPSAEPQPRLAARLRSPVQLDAYGLRFWQHFATLLRRIRVLSECDCHALAAAAQWWSVYQRSMRELKGSLTHTTEANGEIAKPAVGIARQAFQQCWSVMSAFGLNPGDRSKLRAIEPKPEDTPADEFFNADISARKYYR